jgi:hypothetical protein
MQPQDALLVCVDEFVELLAAVSGLPAEDVAEQFRRFRNGANAEDRERGRHDSPY